MSQIKLAKFLAMMGVASRRKATGLISQGLVMVNGQVEANVAQRVDQQADQITLDGQVLNLPNRLVVLSLNKPTGVISTVSDPEGRPTVVDFIPSQFRDLRLFPVGRLDEDSQGLIILTNDGDLAYRLTHPKFRVAKKYLVETNRRLTEKELLGLERGVRVQGKLARPESVELKSNADSGALIEVVLTEGRNRQVRRMMKAINHEVVKLERREFGPYQLSDLELGQVRLESDRRHEAIAKE